MTETVVSEDGKEFVVRNLEKVLFPEEELTKAHLIDYYLAVSHVLLPHLKHRPLVFTRYPDGIDGKWFYQKDLMPGAPDWIQTYPYHSDRTDRTLRLCLCHDRATLAWVASMGCIELHPWMSRTHLLDFPDYAAFDLDPAAPADFDDAREVAVRLRSLLNELGIEPLLKTSGATGLHVYVPLEPVHTYDRTRQFVHRVAVVMRQRYPSQITLERPVRNRTGRVYIDYLQIYRGKTLVAPYSVRPRPAAPVSTPIDWSELNAVKPDSLTIMSVPARIRGTGDPFTPVRPAIRLSDDTEWGL